MTRITASTSDVTAPTLICISEQWLLAIGMSRDAIRATVPREIEDPTGGIVRTPLANWGGNGNGGADTRSLASIPNPRRLVLIGVSEGYGGPGSLGPVTLISPDPYALQTDLATIEAVLAELDRLPARYRHVYVNIRAACIAYNKTNQSNKEDGDLAPRT